MIELLVVISIIAILAGLLLPALAAVKNRAKAARAKVEINHFVTSIKGYESDYNRMPAGKIVRQVAGDDDFTFPSTRPDRVIDWVLVPADWRIASKRVVPVQHSDHRPVVVTVLNDDF